MNLDSFADKATRAYEALGFSGSYLYIGLVKSKNAKRWQLEFEASSVTSFTVYGETADEAITEAHQKLIAYFDAKIKSHAQALAIMNDVA